jgi:hypothetical protein
MVLPEPQFGDFNVLRGDLSVLVSSEFYKERIGIINQMMKNENP